MQVNLFYHLMMKSTINRPKSQEWPTGDHAGIITGAGNMKIDGTR
jgi:hypothetical protein